MYSNSVMAILGFSLKLLALASQSISQDKNQSIAFIEWASSPAQHFSCFFCKVVHYTASVPHLTGRTAQHSNYQQMNLPKEEIWLQNVTKTA